MHNNERTELETWEGISANAYDAWLKAALYDGVEISEPLIYVQEVK